MNVLLRLLQKSIYTVLGKDSVSIIGPVQIQIYLYILDILFVILYNFVKFAIHSDVFV